MSEGQMTMLIPIIAVTLSLSIAIVFIITRSVRQKHQIELRHKERMAAIDKGLDLPPDPVPLERVSRPRYLLRGLVWLGVGLALVFAGKPLFDEQANAFGWIPAAVGLAYLIFYAIEGRKEVAAKDSKSPDSATPGSGT
jgi:hypothetical protein